MKLKKVKLAIGLAGKAQEKAITLIVGKRCQIGFRRGVFKLRDLDAIQSDGGEFITPEYRTSPVFATLKEAVAEAKKRGVL